MSEPTPLEAIFFAALEKPAAERSSYLAEACGGDADLRRRVERMLTAQMDAASFLETPPSAIVREAIPTLDQSPLEKPGTQIGPYKLLQQIGEGGMGVVYMAEQTEPVKRRVALKIIKPGMDTRQVIARFDAERQALSLMDHPNIAKVLDAGTTGEPGSVSSGRPYFVMELVKGQPITQYCDEKHLTPRQRLELLLPVCQAIQHAHQKGIIHRDIKPTNILVAEYDHQPVPKVIDFGVAKATGQTLTEKTMFTGLGQIVGTLEYMSPEQAKVNQLDIDTRSDIYSLGVLLYELLTGSTPFDRKRLQSAAFDEMLRIIREEEPPKPSTRLSDLSSPHAERAGDGTRSVPPTLASIAAQRHTEPAKLTKLVRGELDWIVMKALEKDRNRRYETANGLAMDVQRYLADEPVQACPPSAAYRIRKFARRNKGPVLAASLVLLVLVAGIIGTTCGMARATFAEAEAVREAGEKTVALGEKEAALATAKASEVQAKAAQKDAQENLKDALAAVDQMLTRVAEDKLGNVPQMEPIRRELLLDALKFYQKFLEKQSDDPVIRREAALAYLRVGRIHRHLGQPKEAERAYHKAFAIFDQPGIAVFAQPALLREMIAYHMDFSWTLNILNKREEAEQGIRRAFELANKLDKEVPENRRIILHARNVFARDLMSQEPEEAEKILKENLALARDAGSLGEVHSLLGLLFMATQRLPQAEEAFRQAVKYTGQFTGDYPSYHWANSNLAGCKRSLARVLSANGRSAEAEEFQRSAVLILDQVASDFPAGPLYRTSLAEAQAEHAEILKKLGRPADAEKALHRALEIYEKLARDFPTMPAYPQTAFDQRLNLGQFLKEAGKIEEASRVYRDAVSSASKLPTDDPGRFSHWTALARIQLELSQLLAAAGKQSEAEAAYRAALTVRDKLEQEFADKAEFQRDLALSHFAMHHALWFVPSREDEGRTTLRMSLRHAQQWVDADPRGRESRALLAETYTRVAERIGESETTARKAISLNEELAAEFPKEPNHRYLIAVAHQQLGKHLRGEAAEKEQRIALNLFEKLAAEFPQNTIYRHELAQSHDQLAYLLPRQQAEQEFRKAVGIYEKLVAETRGENAGLLANLGHSRRFLAYCVWRAGDTKEAEQLSGEALNDFEKLTAAHPDVSAYWHFHADSQRLVGRFLALRKQYPAAEKAYRRAIEVHEQRMARFPEQPIIRAGDESLRLREVAAAYVGLADVLAVTSRTQEAETFHKGALALNRKAIELEPDSPGAKNQLAWILATFPEAKWRDPKQAVVLARKAIELKPEEGVYWNTLGVAQYRAGDWKAAVAALEKSMERRRGDWFFLAMAHWQLGEKDKAREWYDKAVQWMEANAKENEELARFRAEAEELIKKE